MKQRRRAKQTQTELCFELPSFSRPIPLDLAADRQVELQRLVGELLVNVIRENAKTPKGGECDE
jgi:hypothetical protein